MGVNYGDRQIPVHAKSNVCKMQILFHTINNEPGTGSPVLRQLHWLPVRQQVEFKLALLVYKALHDATAAYLVDDCQLVSHAGRRRLRSADIDTCCVPWTNTQRLGDRSFAAAGPGLWNSLPARIHQPDNDIGEFRRQLKSFLFN